MDYMRAVKDWNPVLDGVHYSIWYGYELCLYCKNVDEDDPRDVDGNPLVHGAGYLLCHEDMSIERMGAGA